MHPCERFTPEEIYESALETYFNYRDEDPELFTEDYAPRNLGRKKWEAWMEASFHRLDVAMLSLDLRDEPTRRFLRVCWAAAARFNHTMYGAEDEDFEHHCGMTIGYELARADAKGYAHDFDAMVDHCLDNERRRAIRDDVYAQARELADSGDLNGSFAVINQYYGVA